MKPRLCTKIVSIFTALAVVLASFSFKVEKNPCQPYTADVSANSAIESCCGSARTIDENSQLAQTSCCLSLTITVEGFNEYEKVLSSPFSTLTYFVFESTKSIPVDYIYINTTKGSYRTHIPPPLITDIQVRDQVFLI